MSSVRANPGRQQSHVSHAFAAAGRVTHTEENPLKYYEDLTEGERLSCQPVRMTREAIIAFAREFDPQPFHVDESSAKASIFGGLVASSLHTLSACTRVVVEAQGDAAIVSGIGMGRVRMFNPVRPGDVLSVEAWWADLRRSRSRAECGLARIECRVSNQDGEPVVEYSYEYLIACREPLQPVGAT
jgi:acyl dehydratase